MKSKELSVELRYRIVSRHRSGERYQNISAALKVSKNTVASIFKKFLELATRPNSAKGGEGPWSER
jgi:transposase